ncbi:hypothetical protein M0805_000327 [Coniferiporia weirii]|nr:hypothetical protein M0805_000327 [Coniferiporia weirii]
MYRSILSTTLPARSVAASRTFHTSPAAFKSVAEKVKETASNVNIKVGQTLAKGIEVGEDATEKVQKATGTAKSKADETSELAKQKADQASAGAKEAKDDFKKNVK